MAQLSRPYQIGLAAVAVLAAAWLLLFQGHNTNSTTGGTTAQVPATPAHTVKSSPAPAKKAQGTAGQATGHGSASSLGSLGHAVDKARGAVSTSQTNAKQLAENSARASSETTTTSTPKPAETTAAPTSIKSTGAAATPSAKTSAPAKPKTATPGAAHRSTSSTALQRNVEGQLKQGKIAVILFWSPKGADDRVVHSALLSLRGQKGLKIAIDLASPSQVASFGTITRGVQVYGTPTILFVNKAGRVLTLTGLQDAYGIAQGVREARHIK